MEEQIIGVEGSRQGERPRIWGAPRLRCCRVHIFVTGAELSFFERQQNPLGKGFPLPFGQNRSRSD